MEYMDYEEKCMKLYDDIDELKAQLRRQINENLELIKKLNGDMIRFMAYCNPEVPPENKENIYREDK